ncbi:hypothetical protein Tco_0960162 [Tanacetum coccineum]
MLAPKGSTYNGRPTFANPMYLKRAQSEKLCLYEIPYDTFDLANKFSPNREETLTLEQDTWERHTHDAFRAPTTEDMTSLLKTCLMPLALKTKNDSFIFVNELKQEMFADLQYVQSLEKEIDELEYDKDDFSNIYDLLLQECVLEYVMCSYLHSLSDLDAHSELQCLYLHKSKNVNIVQLIIFIVDSGCTKHITGGLKLLCNFVKKYLVTVCFRNDQFAPILGYGDLV